MYSKLTWIVNINILILFSEKSYKNQGKTFYQKYLWAYSWDILQFNSKRLYNLDLKNLGLTLWYIGLGLEKKIELPYWTRIGVRLKTYSDDLTGFELIVWYIGLNLEKQLD